jgi:hypothetical protein
VHGTAARYFTALELRERRPAPGGSDGPGKGEATCIYHLRDMEMGHLAKKLGVEREMDGSGYLATIATYHHPRKNAIYLLASEGFWQCDKFRIRAVIPHPPLVE